MMVPCLRWVLAFALPLITSIGCENTIREEFHTVETENLVLIDSDGQRYRLTVESADETARGSSVWAEFHTVQTQKLYLVGKDGKKHQLMVSGEGTEGLSCQVQAR